MKLTLFTVEEANRTARELRPLLERLMRLKHDFDRLQPRVDVLTLVAAGTSKGNPDAAELARRVAERDALAERIAEGVRAVHRRGCLVKDLDRGLVDFYSVAGDRLIFLCWHPGEAEVSHWHGIEDGYRERRPLDRVEPE